MRNAVSSGLTRYRESPVGRAHIHLARLLLVYALLAAAAALWVMAWGLIFGRYPGTWSTLRWVTDGIAIGMAISPVQALAVTALWSGVEEVY